MDKNISISLNNVSKSFYLNKRYGLKHKVLLPKENSKEKIQVIKDLSFEIKKGETVGLFGDNGSGKSTVLRLIAKIIRPDSGDISVSGKVAPVIELGSGLHPELTGKDNIFLYASILGVKKKYLETYYKKIISFSGLSKFLEVPLKKYSSGMKTRLAFSVAIFSNADIFLLDEVFSVGDLSFRGKSTRLLKKLKKKKTILLASHDIQLLQDVCDRILILDKKKIINNENEMLISYIKSMNINEKFTCKVISDSMYPAIKVGDNITIKRTLFSQIKNGDIIAFHLTQMPQIIIHRVYALLHKEKICITKGDNSRLDKWTINSSNYLGKVTKVDKKY